MTSWKERTAYVFIRTEGKYTENVWKKVQKWEESIGAWIVTGDWDVLLWIDTQNLDRVYKKVTELRKWDGVIATSTHFVYEGLKNGTTWWSQPCGAWVLVRDRTLNGNLESIAKQKYVVSVASAPGQWDYIVWVNGSSWDEVLENTWALHTKGYQTLTKIPQKSWWNPAWQNKSWWE